MKLRALRVTVQARRRSSSEHVVDEGEAVGQPPRERLGIERSENRLGDSVGSGAFGRRAAQERIHELSRPTALDERQRALGIVTRRDLEAHHVVEERKGLVEEGRLEAGVPEGNPLALRRSGCPPGGALRRHRPGRAPRRHGPRGGGGRGPARGPRPGSRRGPIGETGGLLGLRSRRISPSTASASALCRSAWASSVIRAIQRRDSAQVEGRRFVGAEANDGCPPGESARR